MIKKFKIILGYLASLGYIPEEEGEEKSSWNLILKCTLGQ